MKEFANTPKLPYVAVIFSSIKVLDAKEYEEMANKMVKLVKEQEGFLGYKSLRDKNGFGITISYWKDLESVKRWRENSLHKKAQEFGKKAWYRAYKIRLAEVKKEYSFNI